jgi:hypothetical protein
MRPRNCEPSAYQSNPLAWPKCGQQGLLWKDNDLRKDLTSPYTVTG